MMGFVAVGLACTDGVFNWIDVSTEHVPIRAQYSCVTGLYVWQMLALGMMLSAASAAGLRAMLVSCIALTVGAGFTTAALIQSYRQPAYATGWFTLLWYFRLGYGAVYTGAWLLALAMYFCLHEIANLHRGSGRVGAACAGTLVLAPVVDKSGNRRYIPGTSMSFWDTRGYNNNAAFITIEIVGLLGCGTGLLAYMISFFNDAYRFGWPLTPQYSNAPFIFGAACIFVGGRAALFVSPSVIAETILIFFGPAGAACVIWGFIREIQIDGTRSSKWFAGVFMVGYGVVLALSLLRMMEGYRGTLGKSRRTSKPDASI